MRASRPFLQDLRSSAHVRGHYGETGGGAS